MLDFATWWYPYSAKSIVEVKQHWVWIRTGVVTTWVVELIVNLHTLLKKIGSKFCIYEWCEGTGILEEGHFLDVSNKQISSFEVLFWVGLKKALVTKHSADNTVHTCSKSPTWPSSQKRSWTKQTNKQTRGSHMNNIVERAFLCLKDCALKKKMPQYCAPIWLYNKCLVNKLYFMKLMPKTLSILSIVILKGMVLIFQLVKLRKLKALCFCVKNYLINTAICFLLPGPKSLILDRYYFHPRVCVCVCVSVSLYPNYLKKF